MINDELSGRVVLVTGASGIAAAGARMFAAQGARVFIVSRTGEKCAALADEIIAAGGVCAWAQADLTIEEDSNTAFDACIERFGRIDGLFAVAGGSGRRFGDGPIDEMPLEGWSETLKLNGHPVFLASRNAVAAMRGQHPRDDGSRGSIVIVASVLAAHPVPSHFATHAYAAVKGAEISLAIAMASYYAPDGITVNVIAPGLVHTPMAARAAEDPVISAYAKRKQPLADGLLEPDDVAAAGAFLLGAGAKMITGQVLAVDGGWGVTEAAP